MSIDVLPEPLAEPKNRRRRVPKLANRLGIVGGFMVTSLVFMAVAAPWLAPYDPAERVWSPVPGTQRRALARYQ